MQYHYPQASLPGLPVELRLIILQHALLLNSRIEIRHQQKCTSNPISTIIRRTLQATISPSSSSRTAWSLLQINSQIRTEALPLFFELCNFHFYDTLTRSLLASFLQTIGGDAVIGRMKHVSFHTRGKCIMFGLGDAEEEEGPSSSTPYSNGWTTNSYPSHSEDYCLRDLTINLSHPSSSSSSSPPQPDIFNNIFTTSRLWTNHNPLAKQLCSNGAFACREQMCEAFEKAGILDWRSGEEEMKEETKKKEIMLTEAKILQVWDVMSRDHHHHNSCCVF